MAGVFKTFAILLLFSIWGFELCNPAYAGEIPFQPGEKLVFRVKWQFIKAGEAVLEVLPIEKVNGMKAYHFVMTAKTYPYIDPFYKVRDRIESYTDIGMNRSVLYKKRKTGIGRKKDITVRFDWENREAEYSNLGKTRKPIAILPGSYDPLSVFYAFRLHELKVGKEIQVPVTDGKTCVLGKARVLKKERVHAISGIYDTYLVEPDLEHLGGVFEKSKDAELRVWVTADARRIPVKIKSKVVIGSFTSELISAKGIE
jgi:hypothetical protein